MLSQDNLNSLFENLVKKSNQPGKSEKTGRKHQKEKPDDGQKKKKKHCSLNLTPSQILIISALLSGVLDVEAIQVDREQTVQVVLSGSLKRKTKLDQVMEQIGQLPFDQVVKSIIENT